MLHPPRSPVSRRATTWPAPACTHDPGGPEEQMSASPRLGARRPHPVAPSVGSDQHVDIDPPPIRKMSKFKANSLPHNNMLDVLTAYHQPCHAHSSQGPLLRDIIRQARARLSVSGPAPRSSFNTWRMGSSKISGTLLEVASSGLRQREGAMACS